MIMYPSFSSFSSNLFKQAYDMLPSMDSVRMQRAAGVAAFVALDYVRAPEWVLNNPGDLLDGASLLAMSAVASRGYASACHTVREYFKEEEKFEADWVLDQFAEIETALLDYNDLCLEYQRMVRYRDCGLLQQVFEIGCLTTLKGWLDDGKNPREEAKALKEDSPKKAFFDRNLEAIYANHLSNYRFIDEKIEALKTTKVALQEETGITDEWDPDDIDQVYNALINTIATERAAIPARLQRLKKFLQWITRSPEKFDFTDEHWGELREMISFWLEDPELYGFDQCNGLIEAMQACMDSLPEVDDDAVADEDAGVNLSP